MDAGLGWLGVGVGAVGCVLTYLLAVSSAPSGTCAEAAQRRRAWLIAGFVMVVTLIYWAISMQRRLPWSPGQTLGLGFLIGGTAGAIAVLLAMRFNALSSASASTRTGALAAHSMTFFGLFGVSLVYSLFRGYPQPALMGFAIGAVMAAILQRFVEELRVERGAVYTGAWATFCVIIAASIIFAVAHFDQSALRTWWALPILIGVTVCVASYIGTEIGSLPRFRTRPGAGYVCSLIIAAIIVIGLSAIYSWRIVAAWQLLEVVAVGIGAAALIAWLAASSERDTRPSGGIEAASLSVLIVVVFAVAAFKLWSGLGIALAVTAAWTVALPAAGYRAACAREAASAESSCVPARALLTALGFATAIVLFRLFVQQYRDDFGTKDLQVHYTFIGALIGAILPFVLASAALRLRRAPDAPAGSDVRMLAGVALVGLLSIVSFKVLAAVWDVKAVLGLVFGLVAAFAFTMLARMGREAAQPKSGIEAAADLPVGLLIIGVQLTAIQFTGMIIAMDLTRSLRILTVVFAAAVGLVWLAACAIAARRSTN